MPKRKISNKYKRRSMRKKMRGGVSFNAVFNAADIPQVDMYVMRNEPANPGAPPHIIDARLLQNGGKRRSKNRKSRLSRRKLSKGAKKSKRLQMGGAALGYSMIGSMANDDRMTIGTSVGAATVANSVSGTTTSSNPIPMNPVHNLSTLV